MSEPYIGEIRMVGFQFAPVNWALADGQLLAPSQNDALFSLYGTIYGGNGRTTFALPDLRSRVAVGVGTGPGLDPITIGQKGGAERATVTTPELPVHNHNVMATTSAGSSKTATNAVPSTASASVYRGSPPDTIATNPASAPTGGGGGQSHVNIMPFQCINFIVALLGIYPSRN